MIPAQSGSSGDRFVAMLLDLFARLHHAGVPVSLAEKVDAMAALGVLPIGDRSVLRVALRSAMVKRIEDRAIFDRLFDQAFPTTSGAMQPSGTPAGPHTGQSPPSTDSFEDSGGSNGGELEGNVSAAGSSGNGGPVDQDLLTALVDALKRGDAVALQALASRFVEEYAGLSGPLGSEKSHYYRVLRAADLSSLLTKVMRSIRADSPDAMADPFLARLELAEQARQVDEFRRLIAEQIRDHLDDILGASVASLRNRRLEEMDVQSASTTDLREMRVAVRPLARKLASALSQRRRHDRLGRLDMRRTLRRSLNTGGVPIDVRFHARRATKPDIVMLCDVSGSVADFAHFTLMLMHALQSEMSRLRMFVFVDGVADVTETLSNSLGDFDPRFLVHQPGVVAGDGHSDYGAVLSMFMREHVATITPATTVIVTGDARTNYRAAGLADFAALSARAKRVYWLNPEPRNEWDVKDSEISQFAANCAAVFEVRTLGHLVAAISQVV